MVLRQYMFYSLPPRSLVIPALVHTFALVYRPRAILASELASHPRAIPASVLVSRLARLPLLCSFPDLARFLLPCGGRIPLMEYNLFLKCIEINLQILCRGVGPGWAFWGDFDHTLQGGWTGMGVLGRF